MVIRPSFQLVTFHPPLNLCCCLLNLIPMCWFPSQVLCTKNNWVHGWIAGKGSSTFTGDPTQSICLQTKFFKIEFTNEVIKCDGIDGIWCERGGKRLPAQSAVLVWSGRWLGQEHAWSNASVKVLAHSRHYLREHDWCQGQSLSHWHHGHFDSRVGCRNNAVDCCIECGSKLHAADSRLIWESQPWSKLRAVRFTVWVMPIFALRLMMSNLQTANRASSPCCLPCKADIHHSSANEDLFQSVQSSRCQCVFCTSQFNRCPWSVEWKFQSHHHRSE